MFNDEICAVPCPRFVRGKTDPDDGLVECLNCHMRIIDEDPIMEGWEDDTSV